MYNGFRIVNASRASETLDFKYSRVVDGTRAIIRIAELFLNNGQNPEFAVSAYRLYEEIEESCKRLPADASQSDSDLASKIRNERMPVFKNTMDRVFKGESRLGLYTLKRIKI